MKKILFTIKFLFIVIITVSVLLCVSCQKEYNYDYRILSKWSGVYDCEKHFYNKQNNVIIDVLIPEDDSVLYFKEQSRYDFDTWFDGIGGMAKIDNNGYFMRADGEKSYFEGYIRNDSLYIKMFYNYHDKPIEPESPRVMLVTYNGARIKE